MNMSTVASDSRDGDGVSLVSRAASSVGQSGAGAVIARAASSVDSGGLDRGLEPGAHRRGGELSEGFRHLVHRQTQLGGYPLPDAAQGFLEPRLSVRLPHLRIHTNALAGSLSQEINSRAFTLNQDIFFAPGEFQPQTESGMRLIAHEVAHTLQTSSAPIHRSVLRRGPPRSGEKKSEGVEQLPEGSVNVLVTVDDENEEARDLIEKAIAEYYGVTHTQASSAVSTAQRLRFARKQKPHAFKLYGNIKKGQSIWITLRPDLRIDVESVLGAKSTTTDSDQSTLTMNWMLGSIGMDPSQSNDDHFTLALGAHLAPEELAKVQAARATLKALPQEIKEFLFKKGAPNLLRVTTQNAESLVRAAELAQFMTEQERANYLARARANQGVASNWGRFVKGFEEYAEELEERDFTEVKMLQEHSLFSQIPENIWSQYIQLRWGHSLSDVKEIIQVEFWLKENLNINMATFDMAIDRYISSFMKSSAAMGLDYVDHYVAWILEQKRRYSKDEEVSDLTDRLSKPQAKSARSAYETRTTRITRSSRTSVANSRTPISPRRFTRTSSPSRSRSSSGTSAITKSPSNSRSKFSNTSEMTFRRLRNISPNLSRIDSPTPRRSESY